MPDKTKIPDTFGMTFFYLLTYVAVVYIAKYGKRNLETHRLPGSRIQRSWFKALIFLAWTHVFLHFSGLIAFKIPDNQATTLLYIINLGNLLVNLLSFALLGETLIRNSKSLWNFLYKAEKRTQIQNLYLIEAFFAKDTVKDSVNKFMMTLFGLDLEKSEITRFFASIFEPVAIFSIFLIWLASGVVIVSPKEVGVFYNYEGIISTSAVLPGIYFKNPWPIGQCKLYEKNKIRVVSVGFEPTKDARHIIWTKSHSIKDFNLIVGDGLEVISIDCQVMYQVKNIYNYLTRLKNPEELIKALAYRFLTLEVVSSTFDEVMVKDRKELATKLKQKIQLELDQKEVGISVIEVVFLTMHPPLQVADSYEDIITAQIDKLTYGLNANSEAIHKKFMNMALSKGKILRAESSSVSTIAKATGDAQAFVSKAIGYNYSPDLTRFRLKLDRLQKFAEGKKLYVVDKTLLRPSDNLFLRLSE